MRKFVTPYVLFYLIIFLCCACGNTEKREIIGYWMSEDGSTISFVDETNCSINGGSSRLYKIYDNNRIQITDSLGGGVTEAIFEVKDSKLKIRLATEESYLEFTKNEDEQKEILKKIRELEITTFEREKIQEQIDSYKKQIEEIQRKINGNIMAIENNEEEILKWTEAIEQEYMECQEAIQGGDDKEYHENLRDDYIQAYKDSIQACNERIAELQSENEKYVESKNSIILEIEKLENGMMEIQN